MNEEVFEIKRREGEKGSKKPIKYKIDDNGCWIPLLKGRSGTGGTFQHPVIHAGNRHTTISKYVWELYNGEAPQKSFIRRKCNNPLCINPEHLVCVMYTKRSK